MYRRVRSLSPLLTLLFLLPLRMMAGTTYTYAGPQYSYADGEYAKSMSVSGSFAVESKPLICTNGCPFTPNTWEFKDGVQTLDNTNSELSKDPEPTILTDDQGTIKAVVIRVELKTGGRNYIEVISAPGEISGDVVSHGAGSHAKASEDGSWTTSH